MPKVLFHQSRKVGGKLYHKSAQHVELSKEDMDHWFTQGLIKAGDISFVLDDAKLDAPVPVSSTSTKKKSQQAQA